jgi:hypothetical protein
MWLKEPMKMTKIISSDWNMMWRLGAGVVCFNVKGARVCNCDILRRYEPSLRIAMVLINRNSINKYGTHHRGKAWSRS